MTFRLAAVSALALLAVAGCQRREEAAETDTPAAVTEAEQAAPLTYDTDTPYADVGLTLPQAVASEPDLHATLYGEGVADLRRFAEGAQADMSEYGEGEGPIGPYSRILTWHAGGETPRLFSLWQTADEYTGGAHPMSIYGAVIWDRQGDRRLEPAALFSGTNVTALDQALCQAVNAARRARTGDASALVLGASNDWSCPQALSTAFTLEPSREAGKLGGLVFLINPYVVGSYAEGPYQVVVPQSAFRSLLNPSYAGEFAGEPVRTGDVTPRN